MQFPSRCNDSKPLLLTIDLIEKQTFKVVIFYNHHLRIEDHLNGTCAKIGAKIKIRTNLRVKLLTKNIFLKRTHS